MRIAVALFAALTAAAQQPDAAWQRLGSVPEGAALHVHQRNGEVVSGKLVRWTPAEIVLGRGSIARADVAKVSRRSRLRGALIGFAVGFAISAPIGAYAGPYIADWGNPSASVRLRHAAGFGIFFGGVGAGLGALAGAHPAIYRAP